MIQRFKKKKRVSNQCLRDMKRLMQLDRNKKKNKKKNNLIVFLILNNLRMIMIKFMLIFECCFLINLEIWSKANFFKLIRSEDLKNLVNEIN